MLSKKGKNERVEVPKEGWGQFKKRLVTFLKCSDYIPLGKKLRKSTVSFVF